MWKTSRFFPLIIIKPHSQPRRCVLGSGDNRTILVDFVFVEHEIIVAVIATWHSSHVLHQLAYRLHQPIKLVELKTIWVIVALSLIIAFVGSCARFVDDVSHEGSLNNFAIVAFGVGVGLGQFMVIEDVVDGSSCVLQLKSLGWIHWVVVEIIVSSPFIRRSSSPSASMYYYLNRMSSMKWNLFSTLWQTDGAISTSNHHSMQGASLISDINIRRYQISDIRYQERCGRQKQ